MAKGSGGGGRAAGGGGMSQAEYNRLRSGDFRTGDFIRDRTSTSATLMGEIIGTATLGNRRNGVRVYQIRNPWGTSFMPVDNAVALGVV